MIARLARAAAVRRALHALIATVFGGPCLHVIAVAMQTKAYVASITWTMAVHQI